MSLKLNCWEYKKCGRESGGARVNELGVCRTAIYAEFNGLNGGKNGGRVCWAISGPSCNSNVRGSFAEKQSYCMACGFYRTVLEEELKTEVLT